MTTPKATVVIPARNEAESIEHCLDSIRGQTLADIQIIVVDGDSEDETAAIVRRIMHEDPRVEILRNVHRTVPYGLNLALAKADAPWLVRVDAHATVPRDYVERAVQLLESGPWGAVGGVKRGIGRTSAGKAISAAMASRFGVGGSTYHYGTRRQPVEHVPFGAYPVALARELGGWGEDFTVNQDFEFDYRVRESGREILFDPGLVIDWECRQSIRALFRQYRRYGKGKVKVAVRHPKSVRVRHLVPPALVLYTAAALTVGQVSERHRRAALLALTPYGAVLLAGTATTMPKVEDRAARSWLPAAFVAMHFGWGLGAWEGMWHELSSRRG